MTTKYVQEGSVINFTTAGAVAAGAVVVVGNLLGVALAAASASGQVIAVAVEGVFEVPKAPGAAWTIGLPVVWDASAGNFGTDAAVTQATGDITGGAVAWAAAASGDAVGLVKLTPTGASTLTP
jgi:predicted RecA/RadA family phage recombinase